MEILKDIIIGLSEEILPEVINVRRHLHRHPELSYQEHFTSAFIDEYLTNLGIEHQAGIAGTGIVGVIKGTIPGREYTIGLRADMDALPITEDNDHDYVSLTPGIMHACGHDAHVAMLLGAAAILTRLRDRFCGTILLVFQPGEEKAPGGARLMIESGIFDQYRPRIFIAQHVLPELNTGVIGYHSGPYMASCDEIYITVKGKGGHAAQPSLYTDQIYIASELVVELKDAIAQMAVDKAPTVFAIGNIIGKGATNIIPEKVEIAGTFRTFDETWRFQAKEVLRDIASGMARQKDVAIEMNIVEGYPVLINDEQLTDRAMTLSKSLLGDQRICEVPTRMGSEDFSFFSERYPSVLYRLGITASGADEQRLHTPLFDIDEKAMMTGVANLVWLAVNTLPYQGT